MRWIVPSTPRSIWNSSELSTLESANQKPTSLYRTEAFLSVINTSVQVNEIVPQSMSYPNAYPFLGIFMGLVVVFIILSILYVAINGLASLQISHAAFDKEMGPAAHKKQPQ